MISLTSISRGDASANAAGAVIRSVSRMAATVMIARSVDVELFGLYITMIAIETIAISIITAICSAPVSLMIPGRGRTLSNVVVAEAERLQLIATVVATVLVIVPICFLLTTRRLDAAVFLTALSVHSMMNARRSSLTATFRSRSLFMSELIIGAVSVLSVVLAGLVAGSYIAFYWAGSSVACLISVKLLAQLPKGTKPGTSRRVIRRSILSRGSALAIGSVASNLQSRTQPLILAGLMGAAGVGLFGAVNMFAAPARMASMCVRSVALPRLARRFKSDSEYVPFASRTVLVAGSVVALAVLSAPSLLFAPEAVRVVLGSEFQQAATALPIVLWCGGLVLLSTFLVCEMQAMGRIANTTAARWLSALASLVMLFPLASQFGVSGACMSVAVGELLMIAFLHVDAVRFCRINTGMTSRLVPMACEIHTRMRRAWFSGSA